MSLGLDLGASKARIERASEHLRLIERELPAEIAEGGRYAIRFSQVDPKTGWCDVSIVPDKTDKPRFGIVFGDVVHNLRCALDYVVTELVLKSGATLTTKHKFPICVDSHQFGSMVGKVAKPREGGVLGGVKFGVALIEEVQPYKMNPNPRLDFLWHVARFDNADKHRETANSLALPVGAIDIGYRGTLVEQDPVMELPDWSPDQEYVICRLRFDPPVAVDLHTKGPLNVVVAFGTPAFDAEPPHAIPISVLRQSVARVKTVVELFELL